jgi:hypothetical protein
MRSTDVKRAFEAAGLSVHTEEEGGLVRHHVCGPKSKARWYQWSGDYTGEIVVHDDELNVYMIFYDVHEALSNLMSFSYTRHLNGATLSVLSQTRGGQLTARLKVSREAVEGRHGLMISGKTVRDPSWALFWRSEPEDGVIADWVEEYWPEGAEVIGRGDDKLTPRLIGEVT